MTQISDATATAAQVARRAAPISVLPRRVRRWELLELAAQGTFAEVYRARPLGARDEAAALYAVKMLRDKWLSDARAVARMRREAVVGRQVAHANLISVLAFHVEAAPLFVVMPWIGGETVAARIARDDHASLPVNLWIVRQVAEALDGLFRAGWIHGDVKPSNVLVSHDGHATLLDLGFASSRDGPVSVEDRFVAGTIHYMAPELFARALVPDIRSDLYSLGVVLYELLTGRRPFQADDLAELVVEQRQAELLDVRVLRPQLPKSVAMLVRDLMAREPLRRPQTPAELVERLVAMEVAAFGEHGAA